MRVVHIGDLHFWHFSINPAHYLGKRVLGIGNLAVRRARSFRRHLAPLLVDRIKAIEPDWILFSGDFTTTSLSREFTTAKQVLDPLIRRFPDRIRAVPGNHDRYTLVDIRQKTFETHLDDFIHRRTWPYFVSLSENVWLIGIDATTSNGIGCYGRIRTRTINSIRRWKKELEASGGELEEAWVLCHFPAEDPPNSLRSDRGEQLRQSSALLGELAALNVRVLYLHGHHHYRWLYGSPTCANLTYVNAGAPLLRRKEYGKEPDLGFMEIERSDGATRVRVHTCDFMTEQWQVRPAEMPDAGQFVDLQGTLSR